MSNDCRPHTSAAGNSQITDVQEISGSVDIAEVLNLLRVRDFRVPVSRSHRDAEKFVFKPNREHENCFERGITGGSTGSVGCHQQLKKVTSKIPTAPAVPEIRAYLAARNLLLREAEENTIETNLRRATAANEFAEECLHGDGRALPGPGAVRSGGRTRARQHCKAVKMRARGASCPPLACDVARPDQPPVVRQIKPIPRKQARGNDGSALGPGEWQTAQFLGFRHFPLHGIRHRELTCQRS